MEAAMFDKLFPERLDNSYKGYKAGLWMFGMVVAVKMVQSLAIIFNGYSTAKDADGIPLDTYTAAASQTIVSIFAIASLWRLTFCAVCVLVLVRHRSAVPLMFLLLSLNYFAGELIFRFIPLIRTGAPPGPIVNLVMFALMILGLALSLRSPKTAGSQL
jgi:hypothetical protein